MTLVMLYRTTVKPESIEQLNAIRTEFSEIYKNHGIEVLGHWKNDEHQNESVYMVKYESESDFQHKTHLLHEDENYLRLTSLLNSIRTDFTAKKLVPV